MTNDHCREPESHHSHAWEGQHGMAWCPGGRGDGAPEPRYLNSGNDAMRICVRCGSLVDAAFTIDHDHWHRLIEPAQ